METQIKNALFRPKLNVGFFFLSLGLLISLITSVISFLNLIFESLDKKFPDVLNSTYIYGSESYQFDAIRTALATLIIFFPVFLLVHYFWDKQIKKGLGVFDEVVKKWLIYIVLFLSSLVVVIDLVTLVRYFVSGEITSRFIYKVLAVLLVALFVGTYYILELLGKKKVYIFPIGITSAIKSSIWVLLVISFGFYVMGSPANQRLSRLDDRKISDLQSIQYQIINYYQQKEVLPKELKDLVNPLTGYYLPVSPEIEKGVTYDYKVIDAKKLTFSLCTTFNLSIKKGWVENTNGGGIALYDKDVAVPVSPYVGGVNESWSHEAGYTCFERTIDKDIYPPFEKQNLR